MANNNEEIIDLTESFTLVNHCNLVNEIIVLDAEDSFEKVNATNEKTKKKLSETRKSLQPLTENRLSMTGSISPLGICPICRECLEKRQLASTKCGHVYCLECIVQSLRHEKKCPTCRTVLRGSSSYHPLFLGT